jgi:hypothetical protein
LQVEVVVAVQQILLLEVVVAAVIKHLLMPLLWRL